MVDMSKSIKRLQQAEKEQSTPEINISTFEDSFSEAPSEALQDSNGNDLLSDEESQLLNGSWKNYSVGQLRTPKHIALQPPRIQEYLLGDQSKENLPSSFQTPKAGNGSNQGDERQSCTKGSLSNHNITLITVPADVKNVEAKEDTEPPNKKLKTGKPGWQTRRRPTLAVSKEQRFCEFLEAKAKALKNHNEQTTKQQEIFVKWFELKLLSEQEKLTQERIRTKIMQNELKNGADDLSQNDD